jgi:hypothetical protein
MFSGAGLGRFTGTDDLPGRTGFFDLAFVAIGLSEKIPVQRSNSKVILRATERWPALAH